MIYVVGSFSVWLARDSERPEKVFVCGSKKKLNLFVDSSVSMSGLSVVCLVCDRIRYPSSHSPRWKITAEEQVSDSMEKLKKTARLLFPTYNALPIHYGPWSYHGIMSFSLGGLVNQKTREKNEEYGYVVVWSFPGSSVAYIRVLFHGEKKQYIYILGILSLKYI